MRILLGIPWLLGAIGTWAAPVAAQEFRPRESSVSTAAVEKAVGKGLEWLKSVHPHPPPATSRREDDTNELVFLTLLHGGVAPTDPAFRENLKAVVDRDPDRVYNSALAAVALAKLDPAGYQWRLVHHAQFLVDNQCENGQWAYGLPVEVDQRLTGAFPVRGTLYGARYPTGYHPGAKPSGRKISIPQRSRNSKVGDNSNAQYAALGLRACVEADLVPDPRCLQDAARWWETDQDRGGGWGYSRGQDDGARPTMTAGGVGSLVIYRWISRKPWADDARIKKGLEWLDANWKTRVPKWQYYYLYGLERAGMLYGTDRFGSHVWYDEGAEWLLDRQDPNGSWSKSVLDTCFAILFLRRATAPLPSVATPGGSPHPAVPEGGDR